jgi:hypothetical protein
MLSRIELLTANQLYLPRRTNTRSCGAHAHGKGITSAGPPTQDFEVAPTSMRAHRTHRVSGRLGEGAGMGNKVRGFGFDRARVSAPFFVRSWASVMVATRRDERVPYGVVTVVTGRTAWMGRLLMFIPVDASAFRVASSCTERALRFVQTASVCTYFCVFHTPGPGPLGTCVAWMCFSPFHFHLFFGLSIFLRFFVLFFMPVIYWFWMPGHRRTLRVRLILLAPCRPFPFRRVPRHCRYSPTY